MPENIKKYNLNKEMVADIEKLQDFFKNKKKYGHECEPNDYLLDGKSAFMFYSLLKDAYDRRLYISIPDTFVIEAVQEKLNQVGLEFIEVVKVRKWSLINNINKEECDDKSLLKMARVWGYEKLFLYFEDFKLEPNETAPLVEKLEKLSDIKQLEVMKRRHDLDKEPVSIHVKKYLNRMTKEKSSSGDTDKLKNNSKKVKYSLNKRMQKDIQDLRSFFKHKTKYDHNYSLTDYMLDGESPFIFYKLLDSPYKGKLYISISDKLSKEDVQKKLDNANLSFIRVVKTRPKSFTSRSINEEESDNSGLLQIARTWTYEDLFIYLNNYDLNDDQVLLVVEKLKQFSDIDLLFDLRDKCIQNNEPVSIHVEEYLRDKNRGNSASKLNKPITSKTETDNSTKNNKLILLDGGSIVYKIYELSLNKGDGFKEGSYEHLLLFSSMIKEYTRSILKEGSYSFVACECESSLKWRRRIYPDYKNKLGNSYWRKGKISNFFDIYETFMNIEKIPWDYIKECEGDDIIATVSKMAAKEKINVDIYSLDMDLLQLVNEHVRVLMIRSIKKPSIYNKNNFSTKTNVRSPKAFIDYKIMIGDKSDNIPGITNLEPKDAKELLKKHWSLEIIIDLAINNNNIAHRKAIERFASFEPITRKLITLEREILYFRNKSIADLMKDNELKGKEWEKVVKEADIFMKQVKKNAASEKLIRDEEARKMKLKEDAAKEKATQEMRAKEMKRKEEEAFKYEETKEKVIRNMKLSTILLEKWRLRRKKIKERRLKRKQLKTENLNKEKTEKE